MRIESPGTRSQANLGDAAKGVAVVAIAIAAYWVYATWDDAEPADAALAVVTSLDGVQLGQKFTAVPAALGPFEKAPPRPDVAKKYQDDEDYHQKNGSTRITVRNGVVTSIGHVCREGRDAAAVNNVACHDFEDRVRRVFGERLRVLCAKVKPDDPDKAVAPYVRAYDAVAHGTRYIVIKDVVQGFIVTDTKELESWVGLNWVKC